MSPRFAKHMQNIAINFSAAVIVAFGWSLAMPAPAGAQQTTTVGQRSGGSVSVDLSVLDQLGSPSNVPQLMRNGIRSLLMPNARAPAKAAPKMIKRKPVTRKAATRKAAVAKAAVPKTAIRKPTVRKPTVQRPTPPAPPKIAARPKVMPKAPVALPPPPVIKAPAPPAAPTIAKLPAAIAPPPLPTQTAALPPKPAGRGKLTQGQQFRLTFGAGKATVESDAAAQLANISKSLKGNETMRLQLLAYSGGGSQTPSQARRLSLSRALTVRSQLMKQGIRSTRIDVRALGNKSEGGPPDRVDIVVTTR